MNTESDWHQDLLNFGTSAVFALGEFSGGRLQLDEGQLVDVFNKLVLFDGKGYHKVEDHRGDRVVWSCTSRRSGTR